MPGDHHRVRLGRAGLPRRPMPPDVRIGPKFTTRRAEWPRPVQTAWMARPLAHRPDEDVTVAIPTARRPDRDLTAQNPCARGPDDPVRLRDDPRRRGMSPARPAAGGNLPGQRRRGQPAGQWSRRWCTTGWSTRIIAGRAEPAEGSERPVHAYEFDALGRVVQERVTTLGTNVDGAVPPDFHDV